jgi:outer membrane protein OmpA-like peptidoglycan-associated protein
MDRQPEGFEQEPAGVSRAPGRWGLWLVGLLALAAGYGIGALTGANRSSVVPPQASPVPRAAVQAPGAAEYQGSPEATREYEWTFTFAPGTTTMTAASLQSVDSLAGTLKRDPKLRVLLIGYCEPTGHLPIDRRLAQLRANSVKVLLEQRAVDGDRIQLAVSDAPVSEVDGSVGTVSASFTEWP